MDKGLIKRIWIKFTVLFALILAAVHIFVHFGLYPLYVYHSRRSIESAYSYCRAMNLNTFLDQLEEGMGIGEHMQREVLHCVVFGGNGELLASDQVIPLMREGEYAEKMEKNLTQYKEDAEAVFEQGTLGEQVILRGMLSSQSGPCYIAIYRRTSQLRNHIAFAEKLLLVVGLFLLAASSVIICFMLVRAGTVVNAVVAEIDALHRRDYMERILISPPTQRSAMTAAKLNELADRLYQCEREVHNYQYIIRNGAHNQLEIDALRHDAVGRITHQLKTPLAIISSQIELERMENDEKKRDYYYHSIMEEVDKMSLLISEILRSVRDEHSGVAFSPRPFSASDLLSELSPKYDGWLKSRRIVFSGNIEPGVYVLADPFLLEQVVHNYMMNACKHTKAEKRIILSLKSEEDYALISVYNDGSGIPESVMDKIWTSYYQGEAESSSIEMGLGLYIVRDIMRQHGGGYSVKNTEGGVIFTAAFPLARHEAFADSPSE